MSKLPGKKPLEKNCLENGQFDSCFSLQAQVFDSTKWKVAEKLEWKDCAIDDRDCHTIKNKCVQVRELAKSRGVYVTNCIVRCCYQDLCNALNATMSPTGNQLEVMANRSRGASGFSTLIVAFLAVLLELLAWWRFFKIVWRKNDFAWKVFTVMSLRVVRCRSLKINFDIFGERTREYSYKGINWINITELSRL